MPHNATQSSYVFLERTIAPRCLIPKYATQVTANQTIGNYWIRAAPSDNEGLGFEHGINSAILRYKGAPKQEPNSTQAPSLRPLVETDLHPLTNPAAVSTSWVIVSPPRSLTMFCPPAWTTVPRRS